MEATSSTSLRSRRALIAAGLGGLAATAAHAIGRPMPVRAGHDATNVLHIGEANIAPQGATTSLLIDGTGSPSGFAVHNPGGQALTGSSANSIGVFGNSDTDQGGQFASVSGRGILGGSQSGPGVQGTSDTGNGGEFFAGETGQGPGIGVVGRSGSGEGGNFGSTSGSGAVGISESGVGVGGTSDSGVGLRGACSNGLALDVVGKARFSTAGSASVAAGQNTAVVANPAATASSHISVTLVGDPGPRQLRWIQRSPGVGFTVHFSGGPPGQRPQVPFTYLIVEPA